MNRELLTKITSEYVGRLNETISNLREDNKRMLLGLYALSDMCDLKEEFPEDILIENIKEMTTELIHNER